MINRRKNSGNKKKSDMFLKISHIIRGDTKKIKDLVQINLAVILVFQEQVLKIPKYLNREI